MGAQTGNVATGPVRKLNHSQPLASPNLFPGVIWTKISSSGGNPSGRYSEGSRDKSVTSTFRNSPSEVLKETTYSVALGV